MFATMKLFFAQRLSRYSDTDPSIKAMAIGMLFVVFIIPGLWRILLLIKLVANVDFDVSFMLIC